MAEPTAIESSQDICIYTRLTARETLLDNKRRESFKSYMKKIVPYKVEDIITMDILVSVLYTVTVHDMRM